MSEIYKSIKQGLEEAIDYSNGKKAKARVFKPRHIDVKRTREKIGMSQTNFAASMGISVATLRHWERGDRYPQGPALVLLNLVAKEPETVFKILHK
ncbi:MAG: NadS family protein [Melioribacteraceae bacterium]|nr:NadS family protein [Melioribacteraceae bacterium]